MVVLGRTEEIILRSYEAFRRGDFEDVVAGWQDSGELSPLPGGPVYHGREEILRFLREGIHDLDEFDFRVYTVLEQGHHALIFGRYSVVESEAVVEKGIFWIARLRDGKLELFEAFKTVGEAMAEFKRRLGLVWS
jgi:ketosteroid isomerase-like protein